MSPPVSLALGQVEVHAKKILFVGPCDAATYQIAKTKLSLEYLRSVMHLPRTHQHRKKGPGLSLPLMSKTPVFVLHSEHVQGECLCCSLVCVAPFFLFIFLSLLLPSPGDCRQIAAIARLRNQLAFATHTFFQQNGFPVRAHAHRHHQRLRGRRGDVPGTPAGRPWYLQYAPGCRCHDLMPPPMSRRLGMQSMGVRSVGMPWCAKGTQWVCGPWVPRR